MNWFRTNKRIYLDYASATPVLPKALAAFCAAAEHYGNPGAIHAEGVAAKKSLEASRFSISQELACKSREVVFISGGTEANNLAILGFARRYEQIRRTLADTHWVVSAIEHPSVLECFAEIERMGGVVTYVHPDAKGHISADSVSAALRPGTVFVSIGWANHEIGTVQQLSAISRAIHAHEVKNASRVIFHSDAGQAPLYIAPQVHTLGVDVLSIDSGKLYGPRGIGALYVSNRTDLARIMHGGAQERGLRAGTENTALAAGFAAAFAATQEIRDVEKSRLKKIRDALAHALSETFPGAIINGDLDRALPHMLNVSLPNISSEYMTLALDHAGISISTKSACREGEERLSHVVSELDRSNSPAWRAANTLRFSFGMDSVLADVDVVIEKLRKSIKEAARS